MLKRNELVVAALAALHYLKSKTAKAVTPYILKAT
jgi:hypothetical protein